MENVLKITNNHDAPLAVAGVTIMPGKTVGLNERQAKMAESSNAVKTWVELKLLVAGDPEDDANADELSDERIALEEKAAEAGVKGNISRMKDDTLQAKIDELSKPPVTPAAPAAPVVPAAPAAPVVPAAPSE